MRVLTTPATMRLTLLLHFLTISFAAVAIVTLRLCIRSLSKFRFPVIKHAGILIGTSTHVAQNNAHRASLVV